MSDEFKLLDELLDKALTDVDESTTPIAYFALKAAIKELDVIKQLFYQYQDALYIYAEPDNWDWIESGGANNFWNPRNANEHGYTLANEALKTPRDKKKDELYELISAIKGIVNNDNILYDYVVKTLNEE